jgi:hypothetical protein
VHSLYDECLGNVAHESEISAAMDSREYCFFLDNTRKLAIILMTLNT